MRTEKISCNRWANGSTTVVGHRENRTSEPVHQRRRLHGAQPAERCVGGRTLAFDFFGGIVLDNPHISRTAISGMTPSAIRAVVSKHRPGLRVRTGLRAPARLAAVLVALALGGCTNDGATVDTLRASGFTNIQLIGYDALACGEDDTCTGFEATGPTGIRVRGAVGCGLLGKGCTVRIIGTLRP